MQQGGGLSLKRPRLRKGKRCLKCYRGKAGCSAFPCTRCFRLCLRCQPRWKVDPGRPFVDIAMSMLEIESFNNDCITILRQYHRQDCLDRTALWHLVCSWRRMIRVWDVDRTRGLCRTICSDFDIASDEVPLQTLRSAHLQEVDAATELRHQLMRTQIFSTLDDGAIVLMAETWTGNGVAFAMNSASKAMLCSDHEADDLLKKHQLLPIHLLACMLDPKDRKCLLQAYFDLCNTGRRNGCAFVKFCERDGSTDLHILRWRFMELSDFPGSLTIAFTVQRVPASRYLTRRPGHGHSVVERYGRSRQDGCTEGAASPSISMLPAMTIFPAFDVSTSHSEASTGRQKLIMQWARAPSPTSTEASTLSSPSTWSSALNTGSTASELDVRTDSESLPPLCWSSRPPSPIPWTHSDPSFSSSTSPSFSASALALTSASSYTSQVTSPSCASAASSGLLLRLAQWQAPLPLQRLPSTWIPTLARTTSPLPGPTPPAVPMGVMWMPQYVSSAVAQATREDGHEQEEDEILQAMRMLINE